MSTFAQSWDLASVYENETLLSADLSQIEEQLNFDGASLEEAIANLQSAAARLSHVDSYVSCRMAADSAGHGMEPYQERIGRLRALLERAQGEMGRGLSRLSEGAFKALLERPDFHSIAFFLSEQRDWSAKLLDREQEELITDLAVDGYHSFWGLYRLAVGKMELPFGGEVKSVGQVESLLHHPDKQIRAAAFATWQKSWQEQADLCAQILNHLAGFRLKVYEHRVWESVLSEPLHFNRMQSSTLDALWGVVEKTRPLLHQYLRKKAEILGVEKLSWVDVQVPLGEPLPISYDEGANLIFKYFEKFHPPMARFAKEAIKNHWIESEDRPGKQPGGFCTPLPLSGESRIFMTFTGTMNDVAVLAHEIGHAYHSHCLKEQPYFVQNYAMNVAETASTLAEMVLVDGLLKASSDEMERRNILDDKLQRATTFFLNLHTRFLFETAFYEERRKGFVPKDRLCELMLSAQKETFGEVLSEGESLFWASKLHFYCTDQPFYNFPYTFGYLLSLGLYARAEERGSEFIDDFLRDTARMSVEELGKKHLNVDLTQLDFWEEGARLIAKDVEAFCG
jgi:pepF/M3 family oligoendopeptidase